MADPFVLRDGANVAVIGGGPAGSFFSIFALKMAKMIRKKLNLVIFEPKDFSKEGPSGCNRCGGIISELLVQTLAVEGINLPDTVVQRGINSYNLHTNVGSVYIETPSHEKTIAAVYRGGGPKGTVINSKESFDRFLLNIAVKEGAIHKPLRIEHIEYRKDKIVLSSNNEKIFEADLVVGATGVKSQTAKIFEGLGFGYKIPETVTAAIAEIGMDKDIIGEHFGSSVQLFLLPIKNIKFAAMIPKGTYLTLCILGKNMDTKTVEKFIGNHIVQSVMPKGVKSKIHCRCLPKMNIRAPKIPFTDRIVICGDAGSTRLYKDGLGAAYIMGKAAARTAVFDGVSRKDFLRGYYPTYRNISIDNLYGRFLFSVSDLHKRSARLTKTMLGVVGKEQMDDKNPKRLSSILWDMFTGNERYRNIFYRAFSWQLQRDILGELSKNLLRVKQ